MSAPARRWIDGLGRLAIQRHAPTSLTDPILSKYSALVALGFTEHDGVLNAPAGCRVRFTPIGRFYEIRFSSLGDGDTVSVVVDRTALKVVRHGVKL